jgi:acetoin utilization protein AcuC
LPPRAGDSQFMAAWPAIETHLEHHAPQFFILQAGADSLAGDPLAQLEYTAAVHRHVTARLCVLASRHAQGRLMVFGGGGYAPANLAAAWSAVLEELLRV